MTSWTGALKKICDGYSDSGMQVDWVIVGSVGSVLQGCDMIPGDIDIYVRNKEDVEVFANLLKVIAPQGMNGELFFTETFPSGFSWTKSSWMIEGAEVEVVHISNSAGIPDSMDGEGIWEGGKYIWTLFKTVEFKSYRIPVIPLEIQLESNLRRDRKDRIESIMEAMKKNGFDEVLMHKAVSKKHLKDVLMKLSNGIKYG